MTQRFNFDDMAAEAMVRVQAHVALAADKLRVYCGYQISGIADRHDLRTWVIQQQRRTRQAVRETAAMPLTPSILQYGITRHARETNLVFIPQRPVFDDLEPGRHFWLCMGVVGMAIALGWLGPAIDAQPDRRAEWLQTETQLQAEGTLARWEDEARKACARVTGENGAYIAVRGGGIVCTDKHGRRVGRSAP